MYSTFKFATMLVPALALGIGVGGAQQVPVVGSTQRATSASRASGGGLGVVPDDFVKLKIAPGFLLNLQVLDDSDFDGSYRVDQEGNIAVPGLPLIHVAGHTVAEAREELRKAFISAQLLKNPRLNLIIHEYTAPQVSILGEVLSPGKYPLLSPQNLVQVLALAGGETISAGDEVAITHSNGTAEQVHYKRTTDAKSVASIEVSPGDIVQVNRAGVVYVMGAVARPGGYVMEDEGSLNLMQAISLAFGTTAVAKSGTVYVLRKNSDGSTMYIELPYGKIVKGKSADVQLQAKDIVYVPNSTLKSIYTSSQFIVESAASAAVYKY